MTFSLLLVFLLTMPCKAMWPAPANSVMSQEPRAERKLKVKGSKSFERDKSKPVRKGIEEWYSRNIAAFNSKDVAAIMDLRTVDFHTLTPDGKVNSRADMEAYTKRLLERIERFISQDFQIGAINLEGDFAYADVTQKTVRMQRLPDGTLHKVEASAVQRERWKRTADGWKLYSVDNIRDNGILIDDKPYQRPR